MVRELAYRRWHDRKWELEGHLSYFKPCLLAISVLFKSGVHFHSSEDIIWPAQEGLNGEQVPVPRRSFNVLDQQATGDVQSDWNFETSLFIHEMDVSNIFGIV